jgi:hypothetical protein
MKNNELFTIKPSLKQYYGRTITKDTKFKEKTDNLFENEDDNESNGGEMENNDE